MNGKFKIVLSSQINRLTSIQIHNPSWILIQPTHGWVSLQLQALWEYRELLYFLVWRDLKARYKQTAIGATWSIIQPLLTAIIFTIIFGLLIHVPSGDIPYPIFSFAALLPWTYFARSIERASLSVVNSANLLTKVYFPRLLIPISAALSGLVDLAISFVILVGMMIFYGYMPTLRMALLPLLVILTIVTALGVSLILSALNVYYRDVQYVVPFLIQLWMYASPIIYPIVLIPERFRLFYGLNPMVSVIEGFRWALFNYKNPIDTSMIFSASIAIGLFIFGLMIFRRMEDTFADVI